MKATNSYILNCVSPGISVCTLNGENLTLTQQTPHRQEQNDDVELWNGVFPSMKYRIALAYKKNGSARKLLAGTMHDSQGNLVATIKASGIFNDPIQDHATRGVGVRQILGEPIRPPPQTDQRRRLDRAPTETPNGLAVGRVITMSIVLLSDYVAAMGGIDAATANTLLIIDAVDYIYRSQLGISVQLSDIRGFTRDPAPFATYSTDSATLLYQAHRFRACGLDIGARIACLGLQKNSLVTQVWTARGMNPVATGAVVMGLSYIMDDGIVCRYDGIYSAGVLTMSSAGTPTSATLVAHELGHNLGAGHSSMSSVMYQELTSSRVFSASSKAVIAAALSAPTSGLTCLPHLAIMTSPLDSLVAIPDSAGVLALAVPLHASSNVITSGAKCRARCCSSAELCSSIPESGSVRVISPTEIVCMVTLHGLSQTSLCGSAVAFEVAVTDGVPYSGPVMIQLKIPPWTIDGIRRVPSTPLICTSELQLMEILGTHLDKTIAIRFRGNHVSPIIYKQGVARVAIPASALDGPLDIYDGTVWWPVGIHFSRNLGTEGCIDCAGIRGGYSPPKVCGCNDSTSCLDCRGVPYGTSVIQSCGCNDTTSCLDCRGVAHGPSAWTLRARARLTRITSDVPVRSPHAQSVDFIGTSTLAQVQRFSTGQYSIGTAHKPLTELTISNDGVVFTDASDAMAYAAARESPRHFFAYRNLTGIAISILGVYLPDAAIWSTLLATDRSLTFTWRAQNATSQLVFYDRGQIGIILHRHKATTAFVGAKFWDRPLIAWSPDVSSSGSSERNAEFYTVTPSYVCV